MPLLVFRANRAFSVQSLRAPLIEVSLCDRSNGRQQRMATGSEPVELLTPVSRYATAQPRHQATLHLATAVEEFTRQART